MELTLIWDSKIDHRENSVIDNILTVGEEPSEDTLDEINDRFNTEYDFDEVLITSDCILLKNGDRLKVYLKNT